jgi:hypothetical protein
VPCLRAPETLYRAIDEIPEAERAAKTRPSLWPPTQVRCQSYNSIMVSNQCYYLFVP